MISRLFRSSFARAVGVLASGTALAQIIPIALTPLLTRVFSQDDLGVFSLYTSFVVVFLGALSLGFSYALVSADPEDVTGLVALSIYSVGFGAIPVSCLALLLIQFDWLGFGALSPFVVLSITISIVVTEIFFILKYVALRHGSYRDIASATVNQSIARIGTQLLMGIAGLSWWGLTFGDAVGRSFGIRRLLKRVPFTARDVLFGWNWRAMKPLIVKYQDFAKYSAPGAVFDSLGSHIVAPLLAAQFGLAVAGQYGVVFRLIVLPITLVGGSIADVFHQRLAEAARNSPQNAQRLFLLVSAVLLGTGLGIVGVVYILGDPIWTFVLGEQWSQAGQYALAIAPRAAILMLVSPISRTVLVFGGQRSKLVYNVFSLIIVLVTMMFARYLNWGAIYTVAMLSWARVGTGIVYFFILWGITRRGTSSHAPGV